MANSYQKKHTITDRWSFLGFSSRIARRFLKWTVIIGLALSVIISLLEYSSDYNERLQELDHSLKALGQTSVPLLTQSVWVFDQEQITVTLKGLTSLPVISTVRLRIDKGDTLQFGEEQISDSVIQHVFSLTHKDNNRIQDLGSLELIKDLKEEQQRFRRKLFIALAYNTFFILLISLTVAAVYQRICDSPSPSYFKASP